MNCYIFKPKNIKHHLNIEFKNTILIILLSSVSISNAIADTIWCKMMKSACMTPEEKIQKYEKEVRNCENLSESSFREGLSEALGDPNVWKFAGEESATSYAKMRQRGMLSICMKRVKFPN